MFPATFCVVLTRLWTALCWASSEEQPLPDGVVWHVDSALCKLDAELRSCCTSVAFALRTAMLVSDGLTPTFANPGVRLSAEKTVDRVSTSGTITPSVRRRLNPYSSIKGAVTTRELTTDAT